MTALALPASPLPKSAAPRPIVFGGWQTPILGADESFLDRLGNRWALDVVTDRLKPEPDGRAWTAVLRRAWLEGLTVLYPWPQPGMVTTGSGAPVVAAGAAGSVLQAAGMTPGYPVVNGQFFSLIHAGRRYLHSVIADGAASGGGALGVGITPMLRVTPAIGDVLEFDVPMIEGKVAGNAKGWMMVPTRTDALSFAIEEIA